MSDLDPVSAPIHDLAAAADDARRRAFGERAGYRRGAGFDMGVATVSCVTGENLATRLDRIRAAAADPEIRAVELGWMDGVRRPTGLDVLRTVAATRLLLPDGVHLTCPWRTFGPKMAQVALAFGADDLGEIGDAEEKHLRRWAEEAGRTPVRRDAAFRPVDTEE